MYKCWHDFNVSTTTTEHAVEPHDNQRGFHGLVLHALSSWELWASRSCSSCASAKCMSRASSHLSLPLSECKGPASRLHEKGTLEASQTSERELAMCQHVWRSTNSCWRMDLRLQARNMREKMLSPAICSAWVMLVACNTIARPGAKKAAWRQSSGRRKHEEKN